MPFATRPLSEKLKGHDVALVIGAPVFRCYPFVPGPYLPTGLRLPHISDDPAETARAPVGDSLIGDAVLALVGLTALMADYNPRPPSRPRKWRTEWRPIRPAQKCNQVTEVCPQRKCLLRSMRFDPQMRCLSRRAPQISAICTRHGRSSSPIPTVIGDGSFQYSVQSIWSAAQLHLPMLILVLRNEDHCILKSFAVLEEAPGVPGLDLPGIDIVSLARGSGCDAARLEDIGEIKKAAAKAWVKQKPTVLEIPISAEVPPLI